MDNTYNTIHIVYTLIYISVILLGGVTLTLTLILNAKEKNRWHKAVMFFSLSLFLYMTCDFVAYYLLGEASSNNLVFILINMSDTFFYLLVVSWLYLIMTAGRAERAIRIRTLLTVSICYLIPSEILSIYLGRYGSYTLTVNEGLLKNILHLLNAGYAVFIIVIAARCLYFILKQKKNALRNLNMIVTCLLIGYMIWIAYWDYIIWYRSDRNLLEIYAVDPLILLYTLINIFLIYYFYKSDPLRISSTQISPDDAVKNITAQYSLSEREHEVLILVNKGLTNKQIAAELSISENTVKRHMSNIFRKTGTQSRHEIVYKISKGN